MANRLRLLLSLLLLTVMIGVSIPSAAGAATPTPTGSTSFNPFWETALTNPLSMISGFGMSGFQKSRLAKAEPNECFKAIGDSIYPWNFKTQGPCPAGYQPKVNDAYVWGLAKSGNRVWWGTGPNIVCLVFSGYLQQTNPIQTDSYVCEIGKNKYGLGDFRPPHIFYYDLATKAQVEVTPPEAQRILGIRSAGSIGDLVLMGGPNLTGGVTFLAFRSSDGKFLGAKTTSYTNIRKWIVINNVLYTGVGTADGRGAILRWKGDVSNPLVDPEVVGVLKTEPAEFACHEGRLFTATWPGNNPTDSSSDRMAGLYMSPVIPAGGLTATHATGWSKMWKASDYDPNDLVASTYGGGALASVGGYLFWGTMHVPGVATMTFDATHPSAARTQEEALANFNGAHRAISIYRGKGFGTATQRLEVAYGESSLPVYNETTKAWVTAPTKMGKPLFGRSGFGNTFNNYTWTMGVYNNQLFVGTMDWSYLIGDILQTYVRTSTGLPYTGSVPSYPNTYGADLMRFGSPLTPAIPVSLDVLGNYLNYGIRTMLVEQKGAYPGLYLGTANPMNLKTDPTKPAGGWELHRFVQTSIW